MVPRFGRLVPSVVLAALLALLAGLVVVPASPAAAAVKRPLVNATFTALAEHTQSFLGLVRRTSTVGRIDFTLRMEQRGAVPFVNGSTQSANGVGGWSVSGEPRVDCTNDRSRQNGVKYSRCIARLTLERPGNVVLSISGDPLGVEIEAGYDRSEGSSFATYRFTYDVEFNPTGYVVFAPEGRIYPYFAPPAASATAADPAPRAAVPNRVYRVNKVSEKDPLVGTWLRVAFPGYPATYRFTAAGSGYFKAGGACDGREYRQMAGVTYVRRSAATYTYRASFRDCRGRVTGTSEFPVYFLPGDKVRIFVDSANDEYRRTG